MERAFRTLALGVIAVFFVLSLGMNTPRVIPQSSLRAVAIQDREPGQLPIEKRLRSIVRRFISTILGEWDPPHP